MHVVNDLHVARCGMQVQSLLFIFQAAPGASERRGSGTATCPKWCLSIGLWIGSLPVDPPGPSEIDYNLACRELSPRSQGRQTALHVLRTGSYTWDVVRAANETLHRRPRPQERHLRSKTLPWAPGKSMLGPRTKDLAARGPPNLRSKGTCPPKKETLPGCA